MQKGIAGGSYAPLKAARAETPHSPRAARAANGPWPSYCLFIFFADFSFLFLFCLSKFKQKNSIPAKF
jgi:hypothetical protein